MTLALRTASRAARDLVPLPTLAGLFRLTVDDGGLHEENCDAATFADAVAWALVTVATTGRTVTLEHDLTDRVLACRTEPGRHFVWEHDGTVTTPALFADMLLGDPDLDAVACAWSIFSPRGCIAIGFAPDEVTAREQADASHDRYRPTEPRYRVEPTRIG